MNKTTLAILVVLMLPALPGDGAAPADPKPTTQYAPMVLADRPIAYWQFNGPADHDALRGQPVFNSTTNPEQADPNALQGKTDRGVSLGRPGPRPERFIAFSLENTAAQFDGQGACIRIADPGADSILDFKLNDTITLEAWVNLNKIAEGQQVYVVGKGRTGNPGFAAENQNYALRLRGVPDGGTGTAAISFLFRSERNRPKSDAQHEKDWHRWTSHAGFQQGSGWHHIAVSYTFGKSKSIRGYLDGLEVDGVWDMGGASNDPPVVDNDELWIGSSMKGNPGSSFDGLIDEVAIYRTAIANSQMERRYPFILPQETEPPLKPQPGEVLVEILEGIPDKQGWSFPPPRRTEQLIERAFGFAAAPKKYSNKGLAIDRSSPFAIRATSQVTLPAGEYRVLLRSRGAARLFVDGKLLAETAFPTLNGDGHEAVPELTAAVEPGFRLLGTGDREVLKTHVFDGLPHEFQLTTLIGGRGLRPELGETLVAVAAPNEPFRLLSPVEKIPVTDVGWTSHVAGQLARLDAFNHETRNTVGADENKYWSWRHELARKHWQVSTVPAPTGDRSGSTMIDRLISERLEKQGISPAALTEDDAFARRVSLDVLGVIPSASEVSTFLKDERPNRRALFIDRVLADRRWADNWVGYWQDVLAENPGLLKPKLNNTGPFRYWIHESFLDNKPIDRFVTELVMMEGSQLGGGPAGFAMATQNDAPMAAKAHILAQAFLAVEMQCARCHDVPFHPFKQKDTFSLAAMLAGSPQKVPSTSTVKFAEGGRKPLIEVTLTPGAEVVPAWPFLEMASADLPEGVLRERDNRREQLAAILTSPTNERFAQVMVNRLWKRYLGRGLVEPVDDWTDVEPSLPELLSYLAMELATHDFDLKHVARLILNSQTYQRVVDTTGTEEAAAMRRAMFATPTQRRLTAEQMVDSLFAAAGKPFRSEELNLDPDGRRPRADFLNLGVPTRAWEFVSLSNERDRPALALPIAQSIIDVLMTFGWRDSRQNPITDREESSTVLQPLILANGVVGSRVTRLSDDSCLTGLCLEEQPLPELVDEVFVQVLSRKPAADERQMFVELLTPGYAERQLSSPGNASKPLASTRNAVSWSNHLSPEATRIKLELERAARAGDPPTERLQADWRERMEDMLWALVNSPEFAFVP